MSPELHPTEVLDTYWRFAAERQAMYLRRFKQPLGPWTNDPILQVYRFTNAFRASDRVSQYLIRNVQYDPARSPEPMEVIFRTLLFKIWNKIETWEAIERDLGPVSWQGFNPYALDKLLDKIRKSGASIYSAAYIMPSPNLDPGASKHRNHLKLLDLMMMNGLPAELAKSRSLGEAYEAIHSFPSMGPFLSFQYAIDINYSSALDHDEADFVVPGPGALDGISKCFSSTGRMTPTDVIMEMTAIQESEFTRLGLDFPGLFGRRLQPIDCQNLFCEISKYSRVAHPGVQGIAGRSKIKQTYQPLLQPMPQPFFPPRWNLDVPTFDVPQAISGSQGDLF